MEANELTIRLHRLTGDDIAAIASELRHGFDCADGEITWWRATTAIAASLKRHHRSREAGLLAHRASQAVLDAVEHSDEPVAREDAILVARAASDVARAVIAEHLAATGSHATEVVLAPWRALVAA